MWIFLSDAFLSIVAHRDDPNLLLVRARVEGDIEQVFPGATVINTPAADYAYRTVLPRSVVGAALAREAERISYPNFKNSVRSDGRHTIYFRAYSAMLNIPPRLRVIERQRRRQRLAQEPFGF